MNGKVLREFVHRVTGGRVAAHPAFKGLTPWRGSVPAGYRVGLLGELFAGEFNIGPDQDWQRARTEIMRFPSLDSDACDYIAILESLRAASGTFVMIEGGAGVASRTIFAACAARHLRPDLKLHFTCVEAEPTHFSWITRSFTDNGIDPSAHRLIFSAIAAEDGEVKFWIGKPTEYGQAITDAVEGPVRVVPAVSVDTLLRDLERVDLMHFDIQGAELAAVTTGIDTMSKKVRRALIGTHTVEIEKGIRALFEKHGWKLAQRWPFDPKGVDGVEDWINPRL